MLLPRRRAASHHQHERGYILLTLMLFVSLLVIAAAAMAPELSFQIKRDREEELIHRGVQYSRAIRLFVKKYARYPTRIEELENTNQLRYLRRRYKDPVTGKEFKLLHMGDVQMSFGGAMAGIPAANLAANAIGATGAPGFPGGPPGNTFGIAGKMPGLGLNPGANATQVTNTTPDQQQAGADQTGETSAQGTGATGETAGGTTGGENPGTPGTPVQAIAGPTPGSAGGAQVFGGGPIVGVTSTSKDKSIRIFNKKDHYNQWQFIYDPSTDRGGLLTTPNQPQLIPGANGLQPGVGSNPGATAGFGAPTAPGGNSPGGFGTQPTQPGQQTIQPNMPPEQ